MSITKRKGRTTLTILNRKTNDNIFTSCHIPYITLQNYIKRLKKHICSDKYVWKYTWEYLDKVVSRNKYITPDLFNIHRLVLISFYVSYKFWIDDILFASSVAKVAGITSNELIQLEIQYLTLIDWQLFSLVKTKIPESAYQGIWEEE